MNEATAARFRASTTRSSREALDALMEDARDWTPPAQPAQPDAPASPSLPALEFDDEITIDARVDALVKGVLHPGDIAAMYGPSGVGKTFAAVDLAYHVALGQPWHGRRVRQAAVLYVGLEGVRGLRLRMVALARQMGSAGRMLARLTINASLDKSASGAEGATLIIENAKYLATTAGAPAGLIIIDTLARAVAGDDENSAQDIAAFVARISAIARATGAAVLVVHHPGKDDARGMRGSTALFAACDAVLKITGSGSVREVVAEKVKDGVIGPLFSYRLEQVKLGIDEDGDPITSCIVAGVGAPGRRAPVRPSANAPAGWALAELEELASSPEAKLSRNHLRAPDGVRLVSKPEWRTACTERQLSRDADLGAERKAFQRAFRMLLDADLIGAYGNDVWLLRPVPPPSPEDITVNATIQ